MRDTEPIEPMWEGPSDPGLGQRIAAAGVALGAGILKRTSPHVFSWAAGQSPGFAFAWGAHEYSLGRQGIRRRRRRGAGWEDNPRSNYSEAVSKRLPL